MLPNFTYSETAFRTQDFVSADYVSEILKGFFSSASNELINATSSRIWNFLNTVLISVPKERNLPLRGGEHYLQQLYPRPTFYLIILHLISDLLEGSELKEIFKSCNLTKKSIFKYIEGSANEISHRLFFPNYKTEIFKIINDLGRDD